MTYRNSKKASRQPFEIRRMTEINTWVLILASFNTFLLLISVGLSLREFIHEYKHQTLVLFKCCLLQPKVSGDPQVSSSYLFYQMLFFGSRCERLCMMQFALISLIPGLLRSLEDCADPEFDSYETSLGMPTSLKTSERGSCTSLHPT